MALVGEDCDACTSSNVTPMTALCGIKENVGSRSLVLFYACDLAKTNDWLITEDVVTDLTAGTKVIGLEFIEYSWTGDAPEVTTIGDISVPISRTYTINGTSLNRQADDTDYDTWNSIYDLAKNAQLRVATLTTGGNLRDYKEFIVDMSGFNDGMDASLEKWSGAIVGKAQLNSAAGGWAVKPTTLVPEILAPTVSAYDAIKALCFIN